MTFATEIETETKPEEGRQNDNHRLLAELAELRARIDELELRIEEYRVTETALRIRHKELKSFTHAVIHDLKHPSIVFRMIVQKLQLRYGGVLDEQGKYYCAMLMQEAERMSAMINMITEFIKTGEAPFYFEWLNVKEVLQAVREEFSHQLAPRGIRWEEPTVLPMIRGDKLALTRVLENFIDNALKYGGNGLSGIGIGYSESRDFHVISVGDDGEGLPQEDGEKIFTQFYRGRDSQSVSGTGLGLAIVKEIAAKHGGGAWMRPGPDGGAIFYISIAKNI